MDHAGWGGAGHHERPSAAVPEAAAGFPPHCRSSAGDYFLDNPTLLTHIFMHMQPAQKSWSSVGALAM